MKKRLLILLLLSNFTIAFLVQSVFANQDVIYVDRSMAGKFNGSRDAVGIYDTRTRKSGSGSETAYNSLMEASLKATAGDTIVIRAGIYNETLRPMRSGNEAAPITYTNYEDEVVVITNPPGIRNLTADEVALDRPGERYGIYIYDKSYVIIEGLHISNVNAWTRIAKSDHIILRNNTFTNALGHHSAGSVLFYKSNDNKILNNTIHNGNDNLLLVHSDRNLVKGNNFKKGRHTLWCIRGGKFNVIRENYFHNEFQKIGEVYDVEDGQNYPPEKYDAAHYNLIEKNVFAKTPSSGSSSPFSGIQYSGQHGIIRQNIFYETTGPAFSFDLYRNESRYNYENRVYNNVFYKTEFAGIRISQSEKYTFYGNIMKNNILYQSIFKANDTRWRWYVHELTGKPVQLMAGRLDGFVFENNNLFNQRKGELYLITYGKRNSNSNPQQREVTWWDLNYPELFKNNIENDPLFVDAANYDFHLSQASQMIDAGAFLTIITSPGGSGNRITVADAGYFYDGFGIDGQQGDLIKLENEKSARILNIDYSAGNNMITLDRQVSWRKGERVSLYYNGLAPDIGAYESVFSGPENPPPILQTIGDKSVDENVLLTFSVNATDPDGDPVIYSALNLPDGAIFSNQTFSWTPGSTQAGKYYVRFIASDGNSQDFETITITVNNVSRPPVLGKL